MHRFLPYHESMTKAQQQYWLLGLCSKERKNMTKLFQIALPRRDGFCRLEAENLNWQAGIHGPDADPLPHSG